MIAVLPDLAWGVGGRLVPVNYPPAWAAVAAEINADPLSVVALPPDSMRRFTWAGSAPVLDPLPRWVRADVLTAGDLVVGGQTVPGEGAHAREVQRLITAGADPTTLAQAGVGWVLNEDGMTLNRIGGMTPAAPRWKRTSAILAHLIWMGMLIAGAAGMAAGVRSRPQRVK